MKFVVVKFSCRSLSTGCKQLRITSNSSTSNPSHDDDYFKNSWQTVASVNPAQHVAETFLNFVLHPFQADADTSDGDEIAKIEKIGSTNVNTESSGIMEKKQLTVEELAKLRMELKVRQKAAMVRQICMMCFFLSSYCAENEIAYS